MYDVRYTRTLHLQGKQNKTEQGCGVWSVECEMWKYGHWSLDFSVWFILDTYKICTYYIVYTSASRK